MIAENAGCCRRQAESERRAAEETKLVNVRERCLRSAERWEAMAARAERGAAMRKSDLARRAATATTYA